MGQDLRRDIWYKNSFNMGSFLMMNLNFLRSLMTRYATHMCESLMDASRATAVHRRSYLISGEHNYSPALSPSGFVYSLDLLANMYRASTLGLCNRVRSCEPTNLQIVPLRALTKVGFHLTTFSGSPRAPPLTCGGLDRHAGNFTSPGSSL